MQNASKIGSNPIKKLRILDDSILDKYKSRGRPTVCIVGNAGVSSEDNDLIVDSDCVIRFNNYATRENISYTNERFKCDILFSTFDLHSNGSKPKDVVIGIPFPFKAKEIANKPQRWYPNSDVWMVNPYENIQMCMDLNVESLGFKHPFPSIGTSALWHMKEWDAIFYICGFSWYYDSKNHKFQGWDLKNKEYPKIWNHNYPLEIEWIIKNIHKKDNFIFSKSCEKIINVAKHILSI